jgi:hypothetical protein
MFSGCVKPYLEYNSEHQLTVNNNNKSFDIPVINKKKYKFNNAVLDAFILSEKTFHLEYVELKSGYTWAGLADGYYQDFLRKKLKNLKKVSHQVVGDADIFLYNQNEKYFYLITLYDVSSNTFIIDYTGDITSKVSNKDKHIPATKRFDKVFNESIVDNDIIAHYFKSDNGSEADMTIP